MVNDKDIDTVLALLPTEAVYYFTQPNTSRALPATELQAKWHALHPMHKYNMCFYSVCDAIAVAKQEATSEDIIFIGGSNYVVGEVLSHFPL